MAGTIGIKIANGEFYPIIEENSLAKKRLVLTTVHNRQNSVQIDLFRSFSRSMLDAQYIGSLVVENIKSGQRGEPSIEMIISSDKEGNINADAIDLDAGTSGEHHLLNVSLKTIDLPSLEDDLPDFDLESRDSHTPASLYNKHESEEERKFPWLVMILATLFVALAIAVLWFFFLGGKEVIPFTRSGSAIERPAPPPPVEIPPVVVAPPPVEVPPAVVPPPVEVPPAVVAPPPVEIPPAVVPPPEAPPSEPVVQIEPPPLIIQAPSVPPPAVTQTVRRQRPPAPVSSYKVPAVIPANGVVYLIRWGDTLWDISEAFYRNPWLYPQIARYNNIPNPDLIIAGSNVRIPPKN